MLKFSHVCLFFSYRNIIPSPSLSSLRMEICLFKFYPKVSLCLLQHSSLSNFYVHESIYFLFKNSIK